MTSLSTPPPFKSPPPHPQPPSTMATNPHSFLDEEDDDDDDCLSLSDLPLINSLPKDQKDFFKSSEAIEEFEFRTLNDDNRLSNADDIFSKGQLLPLRLSSVGSQTISSSSRSSSSYERTTASSSNIFYSYPSPRPQLRTSIARRSTNSAPSGWAMFRLGIARAPENIELHDLRQRLRKSTSQVDKGTTNKRTAPRAMGLGCICGPGAVEPEKGRKGKLGLKREESMCRSRVIEWLEELSIGKGLIG